LASAKPLILIDNMLLLTAKLDRTIKRFGLMGNAAMAEQAGVWQPRQLEFHRHCEEPTGRANARPMTGSATKQSILSLRGEMDCFAALAMTASKFQIQIRDLAAPVARGLALTFRPLQQEGAGNAGRPMRPIAACAEVVVASTRVSQVTPESSGIPRAMVLRLMSYSPRRSGFFVTVTPEKLASHELDASVEASGPYDFAVRIKRCSSKAPTRPPHPAPTSVTIAKRPSVWDGTAQVIKLIWVSGEAEYFCPKGWTAHALICPSGRKEDLNQGVDSSARSQMRISTVCHSGRRYADTA
jgi:hypothetical protein